METDEISMFEELKATLGDKIDDATLKKEIDKYLNQYGIEPGRTKIAIKKKYSGEQPRPVTVTGEAVTKKIGELTGKESNVTIIAKAVFAETKEITANGQQKTILSGIIGDDTGTCSFTVWDTKDMNIVKGDVYTFKGAYCKTWNDRIQVNVGIRGSVEHTENVSMDVPDRVITTEAKEVTVNQIRENMGSVTVCGRILSLENRTVSVKGEEKGIYSGIFSDGTGKIQFSSWNEVSFKEGDAVRITNAYIRGWKGIPQLNIGDRATIDLIDDTFAIEPEVKAPKNLKETVAKGGSIDAIAIGTIVDIKVGSGIIYRCPECNRSILNGECATHGMVDPIADLRIKAVLDDGTAAISCIMNRSETEKLTGLSLSEAQDIARSNGADAVVNVIANKILMKTMSLNGRLTVDEYGPSMIVSSSKFTEVNVEEEAREIKDAIDMALGGMI